MAEMGNMVEREKWRWQEPGAAWKGVGLYHFTLTVSDRKPFLGSLVVPDSDPSRAYVRRTALGDALVDCLLGIPTYHPEVEILHFCLMPDHLHAVLYVRRSMPKGIGTLARGFWQAAKKLGRCCMAGAASGFPPFLFLRMIFGKSSKERAHACKRPLPPCAGSWAMRPITASRLSLRRCLSFAPWRATPNCPPPSATLT